MYLIKRSTLYNAFLQGKNQRQWLGKTKWTYNVACCFDVHFEMCTDTGHILTLDGSIQDIHGFRLKKKVTLEALWRWTDLWARLGYDLLVVVDRDRYFVRTKVLSLQPFVFDSTVWSDIPNEEWRRSRKTRFAKYSTLREPPTKSKYPKGCFEECNFIFPLIDFRCYYTLFLASSSYAIHFRLNKLLKPKSSEVGESSRLPGELAWNVRLITIYVLKHWYSL